ncbi:metacaspase-9 [Quercus suber]|uniref:Metacaspase-9 n=1 Tax=Quercus suber TaxID=58331 RepID=A0AAW0KTC6_QUESU|nr:metacaspase-9 [Quercus suber]
MENGNKRLAVLVGCNYPNTPHELNGCINNVLAMRDVLVKRYGFNHNHIELLTNAPGSLVMPTGANIKKALDQMLKKAEPGDVVFLQYSRHGTKIPSAKPGHPFRQDEAVVPCDFNLITELFGADASHKFNIHPHELDSSESLRTEEGILLSGCQANETSADMNPMMTGGKAYRAFSNAVQMVLKDHLGSLSNKEVMLLARKSLEAGDFAQHPCLYCSDENAYAPFLWQPQGSGL